jgi:hypothetical protein
MRLLVIPAVAALAFVCVPVASADIGGQVPSPGGCDYPAVGTFGAAGGEYDFACQFPVEINGSRHTTLFGGGMWQVTATAGVSFMMFNASIGAQIPAGVLRGISYWACPDFSMAEAPNPPGAWKNEIHPKPCKTLAPRPIPIGADQMPAPPPGAPPIPPPPEPVTPPSSVPPWQPGLSPQVTNPDNPNPDAVTPEPPR